MTESDVKPEKNHMTSRGIVVMNSNNITLVDQMIKTWLKLWHA